jgi:hypothetical protein
VSVIRVEGIPMEICCVKIVLLMFAFFICMSLKTMKAIAKAYWDLIEREGRTAD